MILFHGSNQTVEKPLWDKSDPTCDFGVGFYLTPDKDMAKKWACGKPGKEGVVSIYDVDLDSLNVYQFSADREWLEFIKANRKKMPIPEKYSQYDLLIGPTADDRLFRTIKGYMNGQYTTKETIMYLNIAGFANQYVFKNQQAIDKACSYIDKTIYAGHEKELGRLQAAAAREEAMSKLDEVQRLMTQRKEALLEEAFKDLQIQNENKGESENEGNPSPPPLPL